MSGLEVTGLVALGVFLIGIVGMLVTSFLLLKLNNSRVLDFFFTASVVTYGVAGFVAIAVSLVYELIK